MNFAKSFSSLGLLLILTILCVPVRTCSKQLPLVGIGVGNLQHNFVEDVVSTAIELGLELVDTSAASQNEALIRRALDRVDENPIILTKIWYTQLGYERSWFSIRKSLEDLGINKLGCVLIHWPKCDENIPWMHCEDEEASLAPEIVNAGPMGSWRDTWRALEDAHMEGLIESIGVSNFNRDEMEELISLARIKPMVFQGDIYSFLFDPFLMDLLRNNNIQFQAYDVVNNLIHPPHENEQLKSRFSNALRALEIIANEVSDPDHQLSTVQLILKWLTQSNVSVIPRASSRTHIVELAAVLNVNRFDNTILARIASTYEDLVRARHNLPERIQSHQNKEEL